MCPYMIYGYTSDHLTACTAIPGLRERDGRMQSLRMWRVIDDVLCWCGRNRLDADDFSATVTVTL